jgi:hypothetical protein
MRQKKDMAQYVDPAVAVRVGCGAWWYPMERDVYVVKKKIWKKGGETRLYSVLSILKAGSVGG